MKTSIKWMTCGASAFFAAALALQAQSTTAQTNTQSNTSPTSGSTMTSPSGATNSNVNQNTSTSTFGGSTTAPTQPSTSSTYPSTSTTANPSSSMNTTSSTNGTVTANGSATTTQPVYSANTSTTAGAQSSNQTVNQQSTAQNTFAGVASDAQVSTIVQQFDTQGPDVVVNRVSTQYSDITCSPENARNLIEALHSGTPVTLTSNVNGQSQMTTFTPTGPHLGYGEAYIALALAAQELRSAGVTSCATPQQWQAVLLGGPLSTTTSVASTSTSTPTQFPGILTLHAQGQGWGQIAQASNVQLGQVLSGATATSPTGYSSSQMNKGRPINDTNTTTPDETAKPKAKHKHHWWSSHDDTDTNSSTAPDHNSSSTHADESSPNSSHPDR